MPLIRILLDRLDRLVERPGDGVAGRAHAELGLQAREAFADRMKAKEQLPRESGSPS